MTTLVIANDIPSAINTVEKLHAWSALLLYNLYGSENYQEVPNAAQTPIVSVDRGRSGVGDTRLVCRTSLILDPLADSSAAKLWTMIQNYPGINTNNIPAGFKVN